MSFYRPHRVAQLVMSFAKQKGDLCSRKVVWDQFEGAIDDELDVRQPLTKKDIEEAVRVLENTRMYLLIAM